jgi:hypothetical protein
MTGAQDSARTWAARKFKLIATANADIRLSNPAKIIWSTLLDFARSEASPVFLARGMGKARLGFDEKTQRAAFKALEAKKYLHSEGRNHEGIETYTCVCADELDVWDAVEKRIADYHEGVKRRKFMARLVKKMAGGIPSHDDNDGGRESLPSNVTAGENPSPKVTYDGRESLPKTGEIPSNTVEENTVDSGIEKEPSPVGEIPTRPRSSNPFHESDYAKASRGY